MQTPHQRFLKKVNKQGPDECWEWTGKRWKNGYGVFFVVGNKTVGAHRAAWEFEHGPIPEGMEIDHVCHVTADCRLGNDCPHRRCVNPAHLRLVTHSENLKRARGWRKERLTHCKRGHEMTPENTKIDGNQRICRACRRERKAARNPRVVQTPRPCEVCGTVFEPDRHPDAKYCSGRCNQRAFRARQRVA